MFSTLQSSLAFTHRAEHFHARKEQSVVEIVKEMEEAKDKNRGDDFDVLVVLVSIRHANGG